MMKFHPITKNLNLMLINPLKKEKNFPLLYTFKEIKNSNVRFVKKHSILNKSLEGIKQDHIQMPHARELKEKKRRKKRRSVN